MLSYIFGYTEEIKEVFEDTQINEIKKLTGELQCEEDKDFMYKSHSKNYELNKQIRRIATKIKLNKCVPNVYKEDDSYLDQKEPIKKRIIRRHKRNDSLESVYEVIHRLANHEKLIDETNNDMYGSSSPVVKTKTRKR